MHICLYMYQDEETKQVKFCERKLEHGHCDTEPHDDCKTLQHTATHCNTLQHMQHMQHTGDPAREVASLI